MKKPLIVKQTPYGDGVFANKEFKKGELITRMKGKTYTWDSAPIESDKQNNHFLQIGKELYLGPSGFLDDKINHSCEPNSAIYIKNGKVNLFAIKDIPLGEQISFDYSITAHEKEHDHWQMECLCESRNCRKIVKDFVYLPIEIKREYIKLGLVPQYILEDTESILS